MSVPKRRYIYSLLLAVFIVFAIIAYEYSSDTPIQPELAAFHWTENDIPHELQYNLTAQNTELQKVQFILQSRKLAHAWSGPNGSFAKMYPRFQYVDEDTDVVLTTANRSMDSQILLYAAVPKTGTTTLTALLKRMGQFNNFTVVGRRWMPMFEGATVDKGYSLHMEIQKFAALCNDSYTQNVPYVQVEHRCFFDAEMFNVPEIYKPTWIGTVRDPIDRYASIYYYRSKPLSDRKPWLQLNFTDFDDCCANNHPDCYYRYGVKDRFQYTYFCGNSIECFFYAFKPALQLAKWNVEKHFAFVGVMEELDTSLRLFETILPKFFANITSQYWQDQNQAKIPEKLLEEGHVVANKNPLSKVVTNVTRNHLLESPVFELEYDFYHFILQRFHLQKKHFLNK